MTEERSGQPQPSQPIRVEDFSQPQAAPSTRSSVRETNPMVADNSTAPGEQDPAKVAAKHRAARESAMRHAAQVREDLADMASQQNPPQSLPEQLAPQQTSPASPASPAPQVLEADLSLLVTKGRIEDEVVVSGYKFRLCTLTSRENAEAMASVAYISDEWSKFSHMTISVLARSITSVNGVALESLYQGQEQLNALKQKEDIIGSWQQGMVSQLFEKYGEIIDRSNAAFKTANNGELKN